MVKELTIDVDSDINVELCVLLNLETNEVSYVVYDPDDCDNLTGVNFRKEFSTYAEALEVFKEHIASAA